MFLVAFLRHGLRLLFPLFFPLAIAWTSYLYLYPIFGGCAFPLPTDASIHEAYTGSRDALVDTAQRHAAYYGRALADRLPFDLPLPSPADENSVLAPFRLLALGDPQLEGDTSIPNTWGPRLPHLRSLFKQVTFRSKQPSLRLRFRQALHDIIDFWLEDVFFELESIRKQIDLFGNDFYLAHIYRTVDWWTRPTHVTVLGDLVGSQWIDNAEFERRGKRYWERVFRGTERVPDSLALQPSMEYDLAAYLGAGADENSMQWRKRIMNVVGNHDIGYAGDVTEKGIARFERVFGKANYELRFELPITDPDINATLFDEETNPESVRLMPELRIVVLNGMNLDTPAKVTALQDETYAFINNVIDTATAVEYEGHFTIMLTHIPLYKPTGVCVDSPFFDFYTEAEGGGLKEQNQLSSDASRGFLEGIFGMSGNEYAPGNGHGRPGIILNGHDHEGCQTFHFVNQTNGTDYTTDRPWQTQSWPHALINDIVDKPGLPGIREITVRSMMGDFGGNAGLLSVWFDQSEWRWRTEYTTCSLGTQHVWWFVHIADFIIVLGIVLKVVLALVRVVSGVDLLDLLEKAATPRTPKKNTPP